MELSNREIALLCWIGIIAIVVGRSKEVRQSFVELILSLFQEKLRNVFALALIWITATISILARIGWWEWPNFKTTVIWVITVPTAMLIGGATRRDAFRWKGAASSLLSWAVLIVFVADYATFALLIELVLFPICLVVTLAQLVLESKAELTATEVRLKNFSQYFLAVIGISVLLNSSFVVVGDVSSFVQWQTIRELCIPMLLSFFFLPFVFFVFCWSQYESAFIRLRWRVSDDELYLYSRRKAVLSFRTQTCYLKPWLEQVRVNGPRSRVQMDAVIEQVKSSSACTNI